MIKKRKYIIKLSISIAILGLLLYYLRTIGYFPILGNIIAEKKLSNYSNETKQSDKKINTKYDWYNSKYQSLTEDLSYRLQNDTIYDENESKEINLLANEKYNIIKGEFSKNLKFPSRIYVWTEINAEDYSIKSQKLYLMDIYNTDDLEKEDSKKMPSTIAEKFINLMGEDYNFTGIQIIYYDKNGGYESSISCNGFKKLEYNKILFKTGKVDRLSETYLDWLSKQ